MPSAEQLSFPSLSSPDLRTMRSASPGTALDLRSDAAPSESEIYMTITQDNPAELRTLRKQLLLARSQLSRLRLKQETLLLRTWAVRGRQVVETSLLLWSVRKGWSLFQGIRQARRAGVTARSAVQMHDGPPLTPGYPEGGGAGNRLAIELALGAITAMAKLVKGLRRRVPTGSATPDI